MALTAAAMVLPVAPASAQTVTTTTTTTTTAPVGQQLFGGSLWATLVMENHAGYHNSAFDGNIFSLTGAFAKTRGNVVRFHGFQKTTLTSIQSAAIEVRLGQTNWVDDQVALEYSVDGWRTAHPLTAFTRATPLPAALTALPRRLKQRPRQRAGAAPPLHLRHAIYLCSSGRTPRSWCARRAP